MTFKAHYQIQYTIPNTIENLGNELLINGIYENETVAFLKNNILDGCIYFDIGANIGSLGLPVVKEKKNIKYYRFEASPVVFSYLKKNFEENNILNFELFNKVVHKDDDQDMKFYHAEKYGDSSLAPAYSNEFIIVKSVSTDRFCKENMIPHIDWMKIDVQGFELYVFQGMTKILRLKKVDNIVFEFEPWAEKQAELKVGVAKEFIKGLGYELFTLKGDNWEDNNSGNETMIWAKPKMEQ